MAAVVAATLLGAVLTAVLLGVRLWDPQTGASDGTAAGLRIPASAPASALPSAPASALPSAPTTSAASVPPAPATATPAPTTPTPAPAPTASAAAVPTRVTVPRLGIDMRVEPQGVDERGQMGLPADPAVAGWYRFGASPSDGAGAVVVAAHIDSRTFGVGPFSRLGSAKPGDEVDLWVGAARVTYRVSQVARVDKAALDADGLFSLSGAARLHLVTCTGDYAPGSGYTQNLVVVADRSGA